MIPLDELKQNYVSQMNASFQLLFLDGYETTLGGQIDSTRFDCDRVSVANLKYLLEFSTNNNLTTVTIRKFDNTFIPLTVVQLSQLCEELTSYGLGAYQAKWTKEYEILNCPDEDTLNAMDMHCAI